MTSYDLEIYKGTTYTLSLTLKDDAGAIIDLSYYLVSGFLKQRYSDTGKLINLSPTVTVPTSGIISLNISDIGTASLSPGYAFYDIQIKNTGTLVVSTALAGKASIYPEITY